MASSGKISTPSLGNNNRGSGGREAVLCAILSLVLFTVSARTGEGGVLGQMRAGFQVVTTPVRYLGATIAMPFQGLGNVFVNLTTDQETLSELRAENEALVARNAELEEAEQTATRLQALLGLQSTYNLQSTAARIISGSTDSWTSTVTIDKGSSSGLAVGMPVCEAQGAIGQIVECGPTTSVVRLVTDENSSVSAMVQSTRAQGMLVGSATGQVTLNLIRSDQTVNVGDTIVTSGLGGVFPKGLPLGKVTSVENNPGSLYLSIVVEPLVHTESYEEVVVITSLTDEQMATSEDIAAADAQEATASTTQGTSADSEDDSTSAADDGTSEEGSGSTDASGTTGTGTTTDAGETSSSQGTGTTGTD